MPSPRFDYKCESDMNPSQEDARAAKLERALRIKRAMAQSQALGITRRPASETPQLSEMQRSLWLIHQLDPGSAAYNLVSAFRLTHSVDLVRLQSALDQVIARHRILRSTYQSRQQKVVQVISSESSYQVEQITAQPGEALETAQREARRPFDLCEGPLVRLVHIQERPRGEILLLLVIHHILADETSLGILWRQLADAYAGEAPQPPADIQFDDFVYWQAGQGDPSRER